VEAAVDFRLFFFIEDASVVAAVAVVEAADAVESELAVFLLCFFFVDFEAESVAVD